MYLHMLGSADLRHLCYPILSGYAAFLMGEWTRNEDGEGREVSGSTVLCTERQFPSVIRRW